MFVDANGGVKTLFTNQRKTFRLTFIWFRKDEGLICLRVVKQVLRPLFKKSFKNFDNLILHSVIERVFAFLCFLGSAIRKRFVLASGTFATFALTLCIRGSLPWTKLKGSFSSFSLPVPSWCLGGAILAENRTRNLAVIHISKISKTRLHYEYVVFGQILSYRCRSCL